jgi:hypothetical protein
MISQRMLKMNELKKSDKIAMVAESKPNKWR